MYNPILHQVQTPVNKCPFYLQTQPDTLLRCYELCDVSGFPLYLFAGSEDREGVFLSDFSKSQSVFHILL